MKFRIEDLSDIYYEEKQNFKINVLSRLHEKLFKKWIHIKTITTDFGENEYYGQVIHSDIDVNPYNYQEKLVLILAVSGEKRTHEIDLNCIEEILIGDDMHTLLLEKECEE